MNIIGNNAPRIFCIILAHFYITVDNQVALIGCRNTNRRIFRGGSDIQITVHNNLTASCNKASYILIRIFFSIALI